MATVYMLEDSNGKNVWLGQRQTGTENLVIYTSPEYVKNLQKFMEEHNGQDVQVIVE